MGVLEAVFGSSDPVDTFDPSTPYQEAIQTAIRVHNDIAESVEALQQHGEQEISTDDVTVVTGQGFGEEPSATAAGLSFSLDAPLAPLSWHRPFERTEALLTVASALDSIYNKQGRSAPSLRGDVLNVLSQMSEARKNVSLEHILSDAANDDIVTEAALRTYYNEAIPEALAGALADGLAEEDIRLVEEKLLIRADDGETLLVLLETVSATEMPWVASIPFSEPLALPQFRRLNDDDVDDFLSMKRPFVDSDNPSMAFRPNTNRTFMRLRETPSEPLQVLAEVTFRTVHSFNQFVWKKWGEEATNATANKYEEVAGTVLEKKGVDELFEATYEDSDVTFEYAPSIDDDVLSLSVLSDELGLSPPMHALEQSDRINVDEHAEQIAEALRVQLHAIVDKRLEDRNIKSAEARVKERAAELEKRSGMHTFKLSDDATVTIKKCCPDAVNLDAVEEAFIVPENTQAKVVHDRHGTHSFQLPSGVHTATLFDPDPVSLSDD